MELDKEILSTWQENRTRGILGHNILKTPAYKENVDGLWVKTYVEVMKLSENFNYKKTSH